MSGVHATDECDHDYGRNATFGAKPKPKPKRAPKPKPKPKHVQKSTSRGRVMESAMVKDHERATSALRNLQFWLQDVARTIKLGDEGAGTASRQMDGFDVVVFRDRDPHGEEIFVVELDATEPRALFVQTVSGWKDRNAAIRTFMGNVREKIFRDDEDEEDYDEDDYEDDYEDDEAAAPRGGGTRRKR